MTRDFVATIYLKMNFNTQNTCEDTYSTVDGSVIGIYNDMPSPAASVEYEPEQEFDKEIFIEAIRAHPCIWDVNSTTYKDRGTKQNAWDSIARIFGQDGKIFI